MLKKKRWVLRFIDVLKKNVGQQVWWLVKNNRQLNFCKCNRSRNNNGDKILQFSRHFISLSVQQIYTLQIIFTHNMQCHCYLYAFLMSMHAAFIWLLSFKKSQALPARRKRRHTSEYIGRFISRAAQHAPQGGKSTNRLINFRKTLL